MELKKLRTYEDALEVAQNKEWKLKRLNQLRIIDVPRGSQMKQVETIQGKATREASQAVVVPVAIQVMPIVVATIV